MRLNFATIFDSNYLSRGLSLYGSLKKYHNDFQFFIIALDQKVSDFFAEGNYPEVTVIPLQEIEEYFPELSALKKSRTPVNYLFTLSPYYPLYVIKRYPKIDHICSLDADQLFFSDPSIIFEDLENDSVLITPHRFTPELLDKKFDEYGIYNVGFQVFKNDEAGRLCLDFWRQQCFEWCEDTLESARFADQKYLNFWTEQFGDAVKPISHIGLGLAPWNINNYRITKEGNNIYVDGKPLILFHYQGLRILGDNIVYTSFDHYQAKIYSEIRFLLQQVVKKLFKNNVNTKDSIERNHANINSSSIPDSSKYSYLKYVQGELRNFAPQLTVRRISSGLYNRYKNFFRKQR